MALPEYCAGVRHMDCTRDDCSLYIREVLPPRHAPRVPRTVLVVGLMMLIAYDIYGSGVREGRLHAEIQELRDELRVERVDWRIIKNMIVEVP